MQNWPQEYPNNETKNAPKYNIILTKKVDITSNYNIISTKKWKLLKTRYNIAKKPKYTSKIHRNIKGKMSKLRYKIQKNWELSQIRLQFDQIIENDFSITQ